jgi:hypothetical protein
MVIMDRIPYNILEQQRAHSKFTGRFGLFLVAYRLKNFETSYFPSSGIITLLDLGPVHKYAH